MNYLRSRNLTLRLLDMSNMSHHWYHFFERTKLLRKLCFHKVTRSSSIEMNVSSDTIELIVTLCLDDEPLCQEQIAVQIIHNSVPTSDLIVNNNDTGKSIYFRLNSEFSVDDLAEERTLFGSVMVNSRCMIADVSVVDGMFLICSLNVLLGLKYVDEHENFFVFMEKQFLSISRSTHTPYTLQFKKSLNRSLGTRKRAATGNIDDELSDASVGLSFN